MKARTRIPVMEHGLPASRALVYPCPVDSKSSMVTGRARKTGMHRSESPFPETFGTGKPCGLVQCRAQGSMAGIRCRAAVDRCGVIAGPVPLRGSSGGKVPKSGEEVVSLVRRGICPAKDLSRDHELDNRRFLDLFRHLGLQKLRNQVSWAVPPSADVVLTLPYEWSRKSSRP